MAKSKKSKSFDYDPFRLLSKARVNAKGVDVFNGGGSSYIPEGGEEFEYTTQNLYYRHNDYDMP